MRIAEDITNAESDSSIHITSRGKVVARLVPPDFARKAARDKLDALGKTAVIHDVLKELKHGGTL